MGDAEGTTTATFEFAAPEGARAAASPSLVIGLECSRPLASSARYTLDGVDRVTVGRGPERSADRQGAPARQALRVELPDPWMSSNHVQIWREADEWILADDGSKNGTSVNGKQVRRQVLNEGDLIEAGNTLLLFVSTRPGYALADPESSDTHRKHLLPPTLNATLTKRYAELERIAESMISVLISGETGTGKELTAAAIHELSKRSGSFVPINCGALTPTLVESELFGHTKGAFSGATQDKIGLVRSAQRGTLFLDEVAELPLATQTKLLRVIQEREVMPVGGSSRFQVDVRFIAATHQNLEERVNDGRFRRDLYARLIGFQMELPPLRERREDLGILIAALLPKIAGERAAKLRIERQAARALFSHDWPLNVRELEQALSAAVALSEDGELKLDQLPATLRRLQSSVASESQSPEPTLTAERLCTLLREHSGNVSAVARSTGVSRGQLHRSCKQLGVDPAEFRK